MGSSSFGDFGLNNNNNNNNSNNSNGRSSSGSSRKGKKCGLEKPKQPQRGLGVAQLEKIRLQNQMMATYFPSFQSPYQSDHTNKQEDMRTHLAFQSCPTSSSLGPDNYMMGFGETTINDIRFSGCHPSATARSLSAGDEMFLTYEFMRPIETLPLLAQPVEDSVQKRRRNDRCHSMGSVSINSDSSDHSQELDLELRLSL